MLIRWFLLGFCDLNLKHFQLKMSLGCLQIDFHG